MGVREDSHEPCRASGAGSRDEPVVLQKTHLRTSSQVVVQRGARRREPMQMLSMARRQAGGFGCEDCKSSRTIRIVLRTREKGEKSWC